MMSVCCVDLLLLRRNCGHPLLLLLLLRADVIP